MFFSEFQCRCGANPNIVYLNIHRSIRMNNGTHSKLIELTQTQCVASCAVTQFHCLRLSYSVNRSRCFSISINIVIRYFHHCYCQCRDDLASNLNLEILLDFEKLNWIEQFMENVLNKWYRNRLQGDIHILYAQSTCHGIRHSESQSIDRCFDICVIQK